MRRRGVWTAVVLAGALGASAGCSSQPEPSGYGFEPGRETAVYHLVLLRRGPKWTAAPTGAMKAMQQERDAFLRKLAESGKLVLAGPFLAPAEGSEVGMLVLNVGSESEARLIAESDPAVKAGRLVFEVRTWLGPGGIQIRQSP